MKFLQGFSIFLAFILGIWIGDRGDTGALHWVRVAFTAPYGTSTWGTP
jgi:hypothetical protein